MLVWDVSAVTAPLLVGCVVWSLFKVLNPDILGDSNVISSAYASAPE